MLLTGAAMSQTRLNIIQVRESWTGMGISETIQYTDACHAILFQQFNCAAAFGNQAVVRTISNPHHDVVRTISNPHHIVVRIRPSLKKKYFLAQNLIFRQSLTLSCDQTVANFFKML